MGCVSRRESWRRKADGAVRLFWSSCSSCRGFFLDAPLPAPPARPRREGRPRCCCYCGPIERPAGRRTSRRMWGKWQQCETAHASTQSSANLSRQEKRTSTVLGGDGRTRPAPPVHCRSEASVLWTDLITRHDVLSKGIWISHHHPACSSLSLSPSSSSLA